MSERLRQLEQWLGQACGLTRYEIEPASADASFRRYFRVTPATGPSLIAMDAPPAKEDSRPFVDIAGRLAAAGLHVPQIHALDLARGFLLLEDLGSQSYLAALDADNADVLYGDAIRALARMQHRVDPGDLPVYDRALLMREMALFPDWLLGRHLGLDLDRAERQMLDRVFECLVDNALAQPVVCVHRDYHSRNLMRLAQANPGVIDFQDAVAGPASYDLVSLLRDCYISWPEERVAGWAAQYLGDAPAGVRDAGPEQFARWFDLMGVQRHLKAAGIFARLFHRDAKPGYLGDIPRTLGYIVTIAERRDELAGLASMIRRRVLPAL